MIEEYIRQSKTYKELKRNLNSNRLSHAILLLSDDKDYLAIFKNEIAKLIICSNKTKEGDACNECRKCQNIEKGINVDVKSYGAEKPIKTEEVNEIVESLILRPYEGDRKIYSIENFDQTGAVAENKLLKSLEEPPTFVTFLLTAKDSSKILQTTLSRVQKYTLEPLSTNQIKEYLINRKIKDAELIADEACSRLTEANKLSFSSEANKVHDLVYDTLTNLNLTTQLAEYTNKYERNKKLMPELLDYLEIFVADSIKCHIGQEQLIENKKRTEENKKVASVMSLEALLRFEDSIRNAKKMIEENALITNVYDQLLLKLLEVKYKCKK